MSNLSENGNSKNQIDTSKSFTFNAPLRELIIGKTEPSPHYKVEKRLFSKYHLLEYIQGGSGKLYYDGKETALCAGQTIFVRKNNLHSIYSDEKKPLKKIWIAFSCNYLTEMIDSFSLKTGVYSIDSIIPFNNIVALSELQNDATMIFSVVNNLHHIFSCIACSSQPPNQTLLFLIKKEIDSCLYEKCDLNRIAEKLNISKSTLIKTFKNVYNITPYRYLLDKKIETAKEFLKTSTLTIKSIALALSFTDEYYFTYMFTQKIGIPPSEYRKKFSTLT